MAHISLQNVKHSYAKTPATSADWALNEIDVTWNDGGAYALLGPSGCGKTTLLNIISGLLTPTQGQVWFDHQDVTHISPDQRNIAQVFQFPVVYDTMTVYDNLAFPLKNRGVPRPDIHQRVNEIANMLDLETSLHQRASGLTADGKQKISLGRGLVRADVNVIMFDEPLTVIDPHLKWQLRSKLKTLHQQVGTTMIYVTHDQTEALTFADQVMVMHNGTIVQTGTPVELFERPQHTFVGHFIGSPGMNILPCDLSDGAAYFRGHQVKTAASLPISLRTRPDTGRAASKTELGIRPEYVDFTPVGIPVDLIKVDDVGRFRIVHTQYEDHVIKLIVQDDTVIPTENIQIGFQAAHTHIYVDGWIMT